MSMHRIERAYSQVAQLRKQSLRVQPPSRSPQCCDRPPEQVLVLLLPTSNRRVVLCHIYLRKQRSGLLDGGVVLDNLQRRIEQLRIDGRSVCIGQVKEFKPLISLRQDQGSV
jgi:hypothetical protein